MRTSLRYLGREYAEHVLPAWAEGNPSLRLLILGLLMWGIDVRKAEKEDKLEFIVPFKHGFGLQVAVAAYNRSIAQSSENDPWLVLSTDAHRLIPISYIFGVVDGDNNNDSFNKTIKEFGNFLLTRPVDFDWVPEKLFPREAGYDETQA